jgi:signal transduction histidine kinase
MRRQPEPSGSPRTGPYAVHMRSAWAWLRRHPWEADLALAGAILIGSLGSARADPLIGIVSLALAATVVARRKYPVQAFAWAAVVAALQVAYGLRPAGGYLVGAWQPTAADIALAVLLYTLAARTPRRTSVAGLGVCVALSAIAIERWSPAHSAHPLDSILAAAALLGSVSVMAWVIGESVAYRQRAAYLVSLEARAAQLEAERDAQARIAAAAERARELEVRRARAVDQSAARLRRIERDLHDGAQVRLAALAMTLGEIKENLESSADLDGDGGRTQMLVSAAHRNAKETLIELRDIARGIHPPVLDHGIGPALDSLGETSAVPVRLALDITHRPSPAIEAIAYFCAAELLANVAKHSGAAKAEISVTSDRGGLEMTVSDDGSGQARLSPGGGLEGLLERVLTVDGRLTIDSPAGGPTRITVTLPGHA